MARGITLAACGGALLAPLFTFIGMDAAQDPRIAAAFSDLAVLCQAVRQHAALRHRLPSDSEGLAALTTGDGRALENVPNDPWNHAYVYRLTSNGSDFALYSRGRDGIDQHGAGDDVTTPDKSYPCMDYFADCPLTPRWWWRWTPPAVFPASLAWLAVQLRRRIARRPGRA